MTHLDDGTTPAKIQPVMVRKVHSHQRAQVQPFGNLLGNVDTKLMVPSCTLRHG